MIRPSAVMVCGQVPARNAPQAGHKTAFKYLAELAETHVVDLLIACKAEDVVHASVTLEELHQHARSVRFVALSPAARLLAMARGSLRGIAPRLASRCSGPLARGLQRLLDETQPELVWLEFSQTFWLVERVPSGLRTVLSAHDIQTQVVASRSGAELACLLGLTFRTEKRFLDRAGMVRVQSTKDAALLESFFRLPPRKIDVAAPALSAFLDTLRRTPAGVEPWSLLFWGAMGRPENAEAAVDFVNRDLPALLLRQPLTKLYIVGSNPTADVKALAGASVIVTGFLDDPSLHFERCSLGIAPLVSGAGVKVKVLEMLRAGMPVVSTPVGAEGIHKSPLLTIADRSDFVAAIGRVWQ